MVNFFRKFEREGMTDKVYIKLNTSLSTCSNTATLEKNSDGDCKASIELRLPENISSAPCRAIDLQTSKVRLSMSNLPIAFIPVDPSTVESEFLANSKGVPTLIWMALWPFHVNDDDSVTPSTFMSGCPFNSVTPKVLHIPKTYETLDISFAKRSGYLPIRKLQTLVLAMNNLFNTCYNDNRPGGQSYMPDFDWVFGSDYMEVSFTNVGQGQDPGVLFGTPGSVKMGDPYWYAQPKMYYKGSYNTSTGAEIYKMDSYSASWGFNIVGNTHFKNLLHFLPWIKPIRQKDLIQGIQTITPPEGTGRDDGLIHVLNIEAAHFSAERQPGAYMLATSTSTAAFGTRFRYRWENMPTILLSPVSAVVILMDGIGVTQQILPINMRQPQGSSLTTSIPVIENYFPLTTSLRDLHDDLLIARETFDDTALMTVSPSALRSRTLNFRAAYITKDGELFDMYIPPNGTFMIQLTFCLHS